MHTGWDDIRDGGPPVGGSPGSPQPALAGRAATASFLPAMVGEARRRLRAGAGRGSPPPLADECGRVQPFGGPSVVDWWSPCVRTQDSCSKRPGGAELCGRPGGGRVVAALAEAFDDEALRWPWGTRAEMEGAAARMLAPLALA